MPLRKECYADMEKYRKTRYEQRQRYYSKTSRRYPYRIWNAEEDKMVIEHDITDTELSAKIQRSVAAIQNRRWQLTKKQRKKINELKFVQNAQKEEGNKV